MSSSNSPPSLHNLCVVTISKERQQLLKEINDLKQQNIDFLKAQEERPFSKTECCGILQKVSPLFSEEWKKDDQELSASIVCGVMTKLKKQLECPICLDVMESSIYNCNNGHPVCDGCLDKLNPKQCPQCKSDITSVSRNLPLEAVAEEWAAPCRNEGCTEVVQLKMRNKHEDECEHYRFDCYMKDFTGTCSQLEGHVEIHCLWYVYSYLPKRFPIGTNHFAYIMCSGELFLINTVHSKKGFTNLGINITHYGRKSRSEEFLITVQLNCKGGDGKGRNLIHNVVPQRGHVANGDISISLPTVSWLKRNEFLVDDMYDITLTIADQSTD